ncbi:MAG: tetratricopeptide repeat protein, partial [Micromonosporaceae bacterium]
GNAELEVRALSQAARAARMRGRHEESVRNQEAALAAARAPGMPAALLGQALESLANTYAEVSQSAQALPLYEEALQLFREQRRDRRTAQVLHSYAGVLFDAGRLDEAERAATEALAITEEIGDEVGTAFVQTTRVDIDLARGDWEQAGRRGQGALATLERLDNRSGVASALRSLADLAVVRGQPADAVPLLKRSDQIWRAIDLPVELARGLVRLQAAYASLGDHEAAAAYGAELAQLMTELQLAPGALRLPEFLLPYVKAATS